MEVPWKNGGASWPMALSVCTGGEEGMESCEVRGAGATAGKGVGGAQAQPSPTPSLT